MLSIIDFNDCKCQAVSDTLTKGSFAAFCFYLLRHPTLEAEPFLVFVKNVGEKEALPESPQVFDVSDSSQTFGLFNLLFFLSSSCFFFSSASISLLINRWSQLSPL